MNALRREIHRQFAILAGGDGQSTAERAPYIRRIYDTLVSRFQTEGWPQSDAAVIDAIRREVERYI